MRLPVSDGPGPLPDTYVELFFVLGAVLLVVSGFAYFSGLDAQVSYIGEKPLQYLSALSANPDDGVVFDREELDLMNTVSERSLGPDAVASERLYCGETTDGNVGNFRLADSIQDSSLTAVSGSCVAPVDIWVHSQPDGASTLSQEDRELESTGASFTCIQYEEIASSPLNNRLSGINCWQIIGNGESFESVPVFLE